MATIVDQDGKPLTQEIATITRDPNRTFFGGVQFNEDDTLKSRGGNKGLKIYQELKRDAHAGAVLAKRKLAVTSRPWAVHSASDKAIDQAAAELVQGALEYLRFNHVCKRMLEATLNGYSVGEVMWELRDGFVLPARIIARDARRFIFGLDDELRLLTRENMLQGEAMPARKFIVHRRGADDDSPYGHGLGSMLFWPVFFKRKGITFWLTFADKFGSPTSVGKYPAGAGKEEQKKLLAALAALSQDTGVIVPEGMVIELLEASRSGSVDTYERLVRYMDEQISKAVLGETMSTTASSSGLGSNQAGVQNDVRLEVARDDADELNETFNDSLVRWIVEYNLPGAAMPRLSRDFATDDSDQINTFTIGIQRLVSLGLKIPTDWVHDRFDIPRAAADEEMLVAPVGMPAEEPAQFAEPGAPLGKATQQRAFNKARQDAILNGAEELAGQWQSVMRKPVEDLVNLLDNTGDLVQFREGMTKLLDAQPDPAAVETIARATFAGHLMGRGLVKKKPGLIARVVQKITGKVED